MRLMLSGRSAPYDTVKDIVTSPVKAVSPDTPLENAITIFSEQGLHYLPVVSENAKLPGIISQSDVMIAMSTDKTGK